MQAIFTFIRCVTSALSEVEVILLFFLIRTVYTWSVGGKIPVPATILKKKNPNQTHLEEGGTQLHGHEQICPAPPRWTLATQVAQCEMEA